MTTAEASESTQSPSTDDIRPFVVVGFDGSPDGEAALLFAAEEAALRNAELRIICVYDMSPLTSSAVIELATNAWQFMAAAAKQDIARGTALVRDAVGAELAISGMSLPGRPSQVLAEHCEGAVMLVVGSRRLGGIGRLFLGSTSTELIHHAPVPVVVVPLPARAHPAPSGH